MNTRIEELGYVSPFPEELYPTPSDLETQRIDRFASMLPEMTTRVLEVPLNTSEVDPKLLAIKNYQALRDLGNAPVAYMLPEYAALASGKPIFTPLKSQSAKGSRHGLFTGALSYNDEPEIEVAIKPFPVLSGRLEAEVECLGDYFNNALAFTLKLGGIQPVGIIDDGGQNYYSLTLLDRTLDTFDNMGWEGFIQNRHTNPGMLELWLKAAQNLALIHDTGETYQGDYRPGNIATNPEGQVYGIDWEDGQITTFGGGDLEAKYGGRMTDFRRLVEGIVFPLYPGKNHLAGIDLFKGYDGDWWEAFREIFFDEYAEWRLALASSGSHHMHKLKETQQEITQLAYDIQYQLRVLRNTQQQRQRRAEPPTSVDLVLI